MPLRLNVSMSDISVADPDLQISVGPGHPDPEIRGGEGGVRGGRSPKRFFSVLRASFWSKNKEGPGPPGPSLGTKGITTLPFSSNAAFK